MKRIPDRYIVEKFIEEKTLSNGPAKRWRDYSTCNWTPIEGQRIIIFKTPLSNKYNTSAPEDNGIEENERFTPTDLIEQLAQREMKLGLVLDFTFTTRYYDPREFTAEGIIYKKMMCAGHVIPKKKDIKRFEDEVKNFLENDKTGSLVGIHCTHGVNRTGYMVCRYLIDCCGYEPEKAIEAFNQARGHPLERENYLEDLKKRLKDSDLGNDEDVDDDDNDKNDERQRDFLQRDSRSRNWDRAPRRYDCSERDNRKWREDQDQWNSHGYDQWNIPRRYDNYYQGRSHPYDTRDSRLHSRSSYSNHYYKDYPNRGSHSRYDSYQEDWRTDSWREWNCRSYDRPDDRQGEDLNRRLSNREKRPKYD